MQMLPSAYRKLYGTAVGGERVRLKDKVDERLDNIVPNEFLTEAHNMYEIVQGTRILTARNDGFPIYCINPGLGATENGIQSAAVFAYIDTLCLLGKKSKAKKIYKAAKKSPILKYRQDSLPLESICPKKGIQNVNATPLSLLTHVNSLLSMGEKRKAKKAYKAIESTPLLKKRSDGLPGAYLAFDGICVESNVTASGVFTYVTVLAALGKKKDARHIYESALGMQIMTEMEDGLPIWGVKADGRTRFPFVDSAGVFNYITALCSIGELDKAMEAYVTIKQTEIFHNRNGLPVDTLNSNRSIDNEVTAFNVFSCIKSLLALHESVNESSINESVDESVNQSIEYKNQQYGNGQNQQQGGRR